MHKENVALCVIAGAFVDEFGIVPGFDNDILLALSRHYIQELLPEDSESRLEQ